MIVISSCLEVPSINYSVVDRLGNRWIEKNTFNNLKILCYTENILKCWFEAK